VNESIQTTPEGATMRRDRISSAYNPKVTTTALLPMTGRVERSIGQQGDH
jgi:hypothetical protein